MSLVPLVAAVHVRLIRREVVLIFASLLDRRCPQRMIEGDYDLGQISPIEESSTSRVFHSLLHQESSIVFYIRSLLDGGWSHRRMGGDSNLGKIPPI